MKFCIAGSGYVGLSLAVMISQKYEVNLLDIDQLKISTLKNKKSPFSKKKIDFHASRDEINPLVILPRAENIKNYDNVMP